jgi:hypothetical protein
VNHSSQTGLALDDGIRDAHFSAKSGKENDELDRINVIRNENKRRLLVLDQSHNVVEPILDSIRLLADIFLLFAVLDGCGFFDQTLLLLGLCFGAVLVQKLESLGRRVAIEDMLELGKGRRDFEPHGKDLLLALKSDIFRPLHHTSKIASGLDVLAYSKVPSLLLNEGVLHSRQPSFRRNS